MSDRQASGPGPRSAALSARMVLALYPPAWRARYGEEVLALLDEAGGGLAALSSLAWQAAPAWIWPPRHLHDRPARMRASLATVLMAWSALTGLGLVFAQLTQLQDLQPPGHPVIGWSYAVFDAALALSGLVLAAGSLPLWLLMLRRARREHSMRDTACLLLPAGAPAGYLIGLIVTIRLVGQANGVGAGWFGVVTLAGFAAAGAAAAGPGAALRRMRPRGPAVRLAVIAAAAAAVIVILASAASAIAGTGLYLWAHDFAGYHDGGLIGAYLALVTAVGAIAAVSAVRGARAALAGPPAVAAPPRRQAAQPARGWRQSR